eukprot:1160781-Prymnesium_polylepis.1
MDVTGLVHHFQGRQDAVQANGQMANGPAQGMIRCGSCVEATRSGQWLRSSFCSAGQWWTKKRMSSSATGEHPEASNTWSCA